MVFFFDENLAVKIQNRYVNNCIKTDYLTRKEDGGNDGDW